MTKPHIPPLPASSPEDDPTGVRALLSSLPSPDPMPQHLVERINASLAAEQAQRAALASDASVSPLHSVSRHRPKDGRRLLFALAGAAAAVTLVTVVGNGMIRTSNSQSDASAGRATASVTASDQERSLSAPTKAKAASRTADVPQVGAGAAPSRAAVEANPSPVLMRVSATRYTKAGFVTQARTLQAAKLSSTQYQVAPPGVGKASTELGLLECLDAIGAVGAQAVQADVALYEGRPAVIIVATIAGRPVAYAVGRQCSKAAPEVLRPATALP